MSRRFGLALPHGITLPGLLDGLQRRVRALHVERVPGASHWIVHEQPALAAERIKRLLPPA